MKKKHSINVLGFQSQLKKPEFIRGANLIHPVSTDSDICTSSNFVVSNVIKGYRTNFVLHYSMTSPGGAAILASFLFCNSISAYGLFQAFVLILKI